ncbi:Fc.00g016880.m01.CDS01 [Cosmosporella sp. VM-42]
MSGDLNFLDLPVDILNLILLPILTNPTPIPLCPCSSSPLNPLPVLLIHPALYAIAVSVFYRANTFVLDSTGPHAQHIRRLLLWIPGRPVAIPLARGTLLRTKDALRRIARLEVKIDRLRGWLEGIVVPKVQDMVVKGDLEHLSMSVRSPVPRPTTTNIRRTREDDMRMFTQPPLEGLLRVLADPYLRTARLWVDVRHVSAWCRFHTGQPCALASTGSGDGIGAGVDGGVRSDAGGHGKAMEIDWREILRVVDPERKDVAVAWAEDPATMRHW